MKRETVLRTIAPLVEGKLKEVKDSSTTRVIVTPDMVQLRPARGSPALEVADRKSLMSFAGLPLGLAGKLSPDTFSKALTELLQGQGQYSMVVKDDKVTSLVPYGNRRAVDPEHLLDLIEKTIPVEDYMRVMVDKQTASLEVAGEQTMPVITPDGSHTRRGDLVKAGVMVRFSPMGVSLPYVQSYGVVLMCTNGAVANTVLAEFTGGHGGGEGDSVWQFFRQSIRRAYNSFDKVVAGWKKLVDEKVRTRGQGPHARSSHQASKHHGADCRGNQGQGHRDTARECVGHAQPDHVRHYPPDAEVGHASHHQGSAGRG